MNDQVAEDQEKQEQWRLRYQEQLLQDRARQQMIGGNLGANAGAVGREAAKLADKDTFNKFEAKLGAGAKEIKAQEHSTGAWVVGLGLAIAKDLLDIATLEGMSWFDWTIDAMLGIGLFFLFGKSVKRGTKLMVNIGTTILEAIPIFGFIPAWSLSVAYLYFKSQQGEEQ